MTVSGPAVWNSLPAELRLVNDMTLSVIKTAKTFLMSYTVMLAPANMAQLLVEIGRINVKTTYQVRTLCKDGVMTSVH